MKLFEKNGIVLLVEDNEPVKEFFHDGMLYVGNYGEYILSTCIDRVETFRGDVVVPQREPFDVHAVSREWIKAEILPIQLIPLSRGYYPLIPTDAYLNFNGFVPMIPVDVYAILDISNPAISRDGLEISLFDTSGVILYRKASFVWETGFDKLRRFLDMCI